MRILLILLCSVGLAWGGAGGPTYTIVINTTPDEEAMLDQWMMVHYCQYLVAEGKPPPAGMTSTVGQLGEPKCAGTPTIPAKLEFMHFGVSERLLREEYLEWGRAEISDILRKNPSMDQNLRNTYPPMTVAERQVVKDAAPIK